MRCPSSGKAAPAGSGGCPSCRRRRRIGEAAAIGGGGSHRGGLDGRPTLRAMREMRSPGVWGGGGGGFFNGEDGAFLFVPHANKDIGFKIPQVAGE